MKKFTLKFLSVGASTDKWQEEIVAKTFAEAVIIALDGIIVKETKRSIYFIRKNMFENKIRRIDRTAKRYFYSYETTQEFHVYVELVEEKEIEDGE